MSISRQLFREFRPLFRLLEDPLSRTAPAFYGGIPSRLNDPFVELSSPAIDVSDHGDKYVLDVDLPGVKKENIEVRISDSGRSIVIEGRAVEESKPSTTTETSESQKTESDSTAVAKVEASAPTQISTERPYTRSFNFSRTVWLPRPVDAKHVSAKLDHGVLTVTAKKVDDNGTTTVTIDG